MLHKEKRPQAADSASGGFVRQVPPAFGRIYLRNEHCMPKFTLSGTVLDDPLLSHPLVRPSNRRLSNFEIERT
jgi:hypothetical protein